MFGALSEFIMLSLYLPCSLKKAMWCGECGWSNELRIEKVWCLACEEEAGRSWWITSPHWPSIISPRKQASYARWPLGVGAFLGWLAFVKNDIDEFTMWSQQKSRLPTISTSASSVKSVRPLLWSELGEREWQAYYGTTAETAWRTGPNNTGLITMSLYTKARVGLFVWNTALMESLFSFCIKDGRNKPQR